MKNVMFYFTGTGNSLSVARKIAEKLGETELISIPKAIKENLDLSYERIGFVFPVYYSRVPTIVKNFIEKLNFNKSQYIFGVITFGGTYGMVFEELGELIEHRGGLLNSAFSVRMPGNYIDKYNAFPGILQKMYFKSEKKKTVKISAAVKERKSTVIPKANSLIRHYAEKSGKIFEGFGKNTVNFHTTDKCNGCRTCEKVCPVSNITMENGKPKWGKVCEHCVACIQWCPVKAIEYAQKTQKRKQYRHPEVKLSDMI